MVASHNQEGLMGFVAIKARKGGNDEFVTPANFQLVERQQGVIVVCLFGFEFIENAIRYQYGLRVIEMKSRREGSFWRTDACKDEMHVTATISSQPVQNWR